MTQALKSFGKWLYLALTGGAGRTVFTIHGVRVHVPVSVGTRIRFFIARKRYENTEAALIRTHVQQGDTVIELGGALGVVSAVIRDQIGPEATHIVLEPNDTVIEICRDNASRNATPGKTIVKQAALAYGSDTVTLIKEASLLDNHLANAGEDTAGYVVAATSLSQLIEHTDGGPYVLVCDIEGMEGDLVAQEPQAFARCKMIIMEVHSDFMEARGHSVAQMIETLETLGFQKVSLERNALFMTRAG